MFNTLIFRPATRWVSAMAAALLIAAPTFSDGAEDPLPFVDGSFTIAVLPDTQVYAMRHPDHFKRQTEWIAESAEERNIVYVIHLGDIVNNNNPEQWDVAKEAISKLDGNVPYALAPGNHDYGDNGSANNRQTLFNDYFSAEEFHSWATFGGLMEEGKLDNSYHLFTAGGRDWIILALEWGPREETVAWANEVMAQHPERLAIVVTHAYLYYDETRYDHATRPEQKWNPHTYGTASQPGGVHDGEELWNELVSRHPNIVLTLNGHVLEDGLGFLQSEGADGATVAQMLVNYQMKEEGGQGFLRLLEILPDGKTVHAKSYSPVLDEYKTDPQNQFTFELQPGKEKP